MKKKSMNRLRLKKSMISNLNAVVAGGPPVPPGSNSCPQEQTCLTCEGETCNQQTCDRTC
ncbi:hypothetical protein [uncultured Kordia sp.]|uniref:hypothetical protein n=1 Tax=uncultured Kordia sp. TaxID=507699 RepID=UPI002626D662|nr:hypothetical protein [uncultured Kordia sp.]